MAQNRFLEIGKIINTHGVRGELKVEPWADSPAQLSALKTLWLDGEAKKARSREHGNFVITKLEGIDTVEAAMSLKNKVLFADCDDMKLPEGVCFVQDLLGLPVYDQDGMQVGILKDVLDYPAGRVFQVVGKEEHLIPEVGGFIQELDPAGGKIVVRMIEGM